MSFVCSPGIWISEISKSMIRLVNMYWAICREETDVANIVTMNIPSWNISLYLRVWASWVTSSILSKVPSLKKHSSSWPSAESRASTLGYMAARLLKAQRARLTKLRLLSNSAYRCRWASPLSTKIGTGLKSRLPMRLTAIIRCKVWFYLYTCSALSSSICSNWPKSFTACSKSWKLSEAIANSSIWERLNSRSWSKYSYMCFYGFLPSWDTT